MGTYLSRPRTEKDSFDGRTGALRFGGSGMQGWRTEMEDSHLAIQEFPDGPLEGACMFGVFDGHGGHVVADYCGRHMDSASRGVASAMARNLRDPIGSAFYESFFSNLFEVMDDSMRTTEGENELKALARARRKVKSSDDSYDDEDDDSEDDLSVYGDGDSPRSGDDVEMAHEDDDRDEAERSSKTAKLSDGARNSPKSGSVSPRAETDRPKCETDSPKNVGESLKGHGADSPGISSASSPDSTTDSDAEKKRLYKRRLQTKIASLQRSILEEVDRLKESEEVGLSATGEAHVASDTTDVTGTRSILRSKMIDLLKLERQLESASEAECQIRPSESLKCLPSVIAKRLELSKAASSGKGATVPKGIKKGLSKVAHETYEDRVFPIDKPFDSYPETVAETVGCTAVTALIDKQNRIVVANAGDSRAVLVRAPLNETEVKATPDHHPRSSGRRSRASSSRDGSSGSRDGSSGERDDFAEEGRRPVRTPAEVAAHNAKYGITVVHPAGYVKDDSDEHAHSPVDPLIFTFPAETVELSIDHKPENPIERRRISAAGGYVQAQHAGVKMLYRVNGNLSLSRTLGDFKYKSDLALQPSEQIVSGTPDVTVTEMTPRDEFLVLACDGVWDVLRSEHVGSFVRQRVAEIEGALDENSSGDKPPALASMSKIAEDVCDLCLSKDPDALGSDNMTCVIVDLRAQARSLQQ